MTEPGSVIITRAQPGAGETAQRLLALGLTPILSPMLTLEATTPQPPFTLDGAGGLIFTSANGVRFFSDVHIDRSLTAWCVGPATETAAREAGFTDIRTAHGNAETLRAFIRDHVSPDAGALLHIANEDAAGNLAGSLRADGFDVRFVPLYRTVAADSLSDDARTAIHASNVSALLIHSAKGAAATARALGGRDTTNLLLVAVSEPAARPLRHLVWRGIAIAEAPNEDALLSALQASL